MQDIVEKFTRLANTAVHLAQEENRRKGIPNVYVLNGVIVWQLPDGTITTTRPKWKSLEKGRVHKSKIV